MVSTKRVCEVVVLLVAVSVTVAAPAEDCIHNRYNQQQTGDDNNRVTVDGFVLAILPADSPAAPPKPTSTRLSIKPDEIVKPEMEQPLSDVSLNSDVPVQRKDASDVKHEKAQRLKQLIANAIMPLLQKMSH